jgi:hypothetical protein
MLVKQTTWAMAVVGRLTNNKNLNHYDIIHPPPTIHNHNLPQLASSFAKSFS